AVQLDAGAGGAARRRHRHRRQRLHRPPRAQGGEGSGAMSLLRAMLVAMMACCAVPALAAPKPLMTDEIRALLTGNTVHGTWAGREYFSYFEANGWTSYVEPGKPSSQGRWQGHDGKYCSKWGGF